MSTPVSGPSEEDLDAAANRLIARLATVLYLQEMSDVQRVRSARSRVRIRLQARATYKRWIDTDRIDRKMGWK